VLVVDETIEYILSPRSSAA